MTATMLTGADIQALKDYVSAPGNFGQNQADSTVRLHVTHSNLKAEFMELRMDLHVRSTFAYIVDMTTCSQDTLLVPLEYLEDSAQCLMIAKGSKDLCPVYIACR